jgi:hypothetical protein
MRTSVAPIYDATHAVTFVMASTEGPAGRISTTVDEFFSRYVNHGVQACASAADHSHWRYDRGTVVNRLLDWSDEARRLGRVRRAEYLVCLAWEAYDRLPC